MNNRTHLSAMKYKEYNIFRRENNIREKLKKLDKTDIGVSFLIQEKYHLQEGDFDLIRYNLHPTYIPWNSNLILDLQGNKKYFFTFSIA